MESIQFGTSEIKVNPIDLYKMEYERCAQRYDDLYKAAWTNFSYIALIAGAILTFGSSRFMAELSILFATFPLVFWWLASFEPLNRYGDQVGSRLVEIEDLINQRINDGEPKQKEPETQQGIHHFQQFRERRFKIEDPVNLAIVVFFWIGIVLVSLQVLQLSNRVPLWLSVPMVVVFLVIWIHCLHDRKRWSHLLRVRFAVRTFAGAIIVVAICSAFGAQKRHGPPASEDYIKRSSQSQVPERLNNKLEK